MDKTVNTDRKSRGTFREWVETPKGKRVLEIGQTFAILLFVFFTTFGLTMTFGGPELLGVILGVVAAAAFVVGRLAIRRALAAPREAKATPTKASPKASPSMKNKPSLISRFTKRGKAPAPSGKATPGAKTAEASKPAAAVKVDEPAASAAKSAPSAKFARPTEGSATMSTATSSTSATAVLDKPQATTPSAPKGSAARTKGVKGARGK